MRDNVDDDDAGNRLPDCDIPSSGGSQAEALAHRFLGAGREHDLVRSQFTLAIALND